MNILFFWLGTSVCSIFMDLTNGCRMFKDAADNGYKININRISDLQKELGINNSHSLLELFIPVFNLFSVIKKTVDYNNIRPMILDALSSINALEEMDDEEKEEYKNKPTLFKAMAISFVSSIREKLLIKITIYDKINGESELYFDRKNHLYKITGYAATLNKQEQHEYILYNLELMKIKMHEKTDEETTDKQLDGVSNKEDIIEKNEDKSIAQKKDELLNLREELLATKEEVNDKDNKDVKKLSKTIDKK